MPSHRSIVIPISGQLLKRNHIQEKIMTGNLVFEKEFRRKNFGTTRRFLG